MLTDNGSGFASLLMHKIARIIGTNYIQATPYNSKGNGTVERANRSIQDKISLLLRDGLEWDEVLAMATFSCNINRQRGNKYSPHEIIFGKQARLPHDPFNEKTKEEKYTDNIASNLELIKRDAARNDESYRANYTEKYDKNRRTIEFAKGDKVLVYFPPRGAAGNKLTTRYFGPYEVIETRDHDIYKLKLLNESIR